MKNKDRERQIFIRMYSYSMLLVKTLNGVNYDRLIPGQTTTLIHETVP